MLTALRKKTALRNKMAKKLKILVVEDKLSNRELLQLYLGKMSDLVFSIDGSDVVDKLKQDRFDVILMDIKLGEKLDGIKLLKKLKTLNTAKNIPVIATTACSLNEVVESEFDGYLQKPFYKDDIIKLVNEHVN